MVTTITPETLLRQTAALMAILAVTEDQTTEADMIKRIRRVAHRALGRATDVER